MTDSDTDNDIDSEDRLVVQVLDEADPGRSELEELERWLRRDPPQIPPRYFYDDVGSRLFEEICDQPEYYPTRAEAALLEDVASELIERTEVSELCELGSGDARKTRILLDEIGKHGPARYVPFDVSEDAVRRSAEELVREFPELDVHAVVGDFTQRLELPRPQGRRLVAFLGGTIGNFAPAEARAFLAGVAAAQEPGELFLLGTDLVKSVERLEAAYDDAQGVTAEFNKNILSVVNEVAGADFDPEAFEHAAPWVDEEKRIEMHLVAQRPQVVRFDEMELELELERGASIRTEISTKYDRARAEALLDAAGFEPLEWFTDPDETFALTLARRR